MKLAVADLTEVAILDLLDLIISRLSIVLACSKVSPGVAGRWLHILTLLVVHVRHGVEAEDGALRDDLFDTGHRVFCAAPCLRVVRLYHREDGRGQIGRIIWLWRVA